MVQQKLWFILQSALFSRSQINTITGSLLNQSIFATFTDLRALNTRYQEYLQNIFMININSLKNKEFEQKMKLNENKNNSTEIINFNLKKNSIQNESLVNNSMSEETQTISINDNHNQTKTNLNKDEHRKRSSSSPPVSPKLNLFIQTTNSNINQNNQQSLCTTTNINSTASQQNNFLSTLAVVASTDKEFTELNKNLKNTNLKKNLSIKLPTTNDYFITNIKNNEFSAQNNFNEGLLFN